MLRKLDPRVKPEDDGIKTNKVRGVNFSLGRNTPLGPLSRGEEKIYPSVASHEGRERKASFNSHFC